MLTTSTVIEVRQGAGLIQYALTGGVMNIGRRPDNQIPLRGESVSRRHARLKWHHGNLYIVDLASTNGTTLNGRRLESYVPYPLRTGDKIEIAGFKLTLKSQVPACCRAPEIVHFKSDPSDGAGWAVVIVIILIAVVASFSLQWLL